VVTRIVVDSDVILRVYNSLVRLTESRLYDGINEAGQSRLLDLGVIADAAGATADRGGGFGHDRADRVIGAGPAELKAIPR